MFKPVSTTLGICLASYTALHGSAVSAEAKVVSLAASGIVNSVENSQALFGGKAVAISGLRKLANECARNDWDGNQAEAINPMALLNAENVLRVMPENLPLPEFAIEPDGGISLDWIKSRSCLFSVSVGDSQRLAFAWLDGADQGHGVSLFDGRQLPDRIIEGIKAINNYGNASVRAA